MIHLTPDQTDWAWAICEGCATLFQIKNIRAMLRDRGYAGTDWMMTAFYIAWGIFNIPAYAALGQYKAMVMGCTMTVANVAWLGMALWFGRLKPTVTVAEHWRRPARLLMAAAQDAKLLMPHVRSGRVDNAVQFVAAQVDVNLANAISEAERAGIPRAGVADLHP